VPIQPGSSTKPLPLALKILSFLNWRITSGRYAISLIRFNPFTRLPSMVKILLSSSGSSKRCSRSGPKYITPRSKVRSSSFRVLCSAAGSLFLTFSSSFNRKHLKNIINLFLFKRLGKPCLLILTLD